MAESPEINLRGYFKRSAVWVVAIFSAALIIHVVAYGFIGSFEENSVMYRILRSRNILFPIAMMSVGVITFFRFMTVADALGGKLALHKEGMRFALTVSIAMTWLGTTAIAIFYRGGVGQELPTLAEEFLRSFTTIVGIVIAFYFTSSAAVQIFGNKGDDTK